MRKTLSVLASLLFCATAVGSLAGCGDDIKTVKTIETQEQEPVRMVSPSWGVMPGSTGCPFRKRHPSPLMRHDACIDGGVPRPPATR